MENIVQTKLNLEFYKGEDAYSDGVIEDEILEIVKNNENSNEVLVNEDRYPILYHLSPIRQNVIEWYNFSPGAEVLEVGAGCGAITGALCEKAKQVTSVDLSKKRSTINAYRNRNYDNLEIIVGNLNEIIFRKKFDYIVLIGVLEYANLYTEAEKPFVVFLEKMKSLLKPKGKIIIAIENKFGLKYWAGCREDHNGEFFSGLENYFDSYKIRTFSKEELNELLKESGYKSLEYYYPIPDYKFPMQVFSQKMLPNIADSSFVTQNYDQERLKLFDESKVFNNLIDNKSFEFFANSFIVIANK